MRLLTIFGSCVLVAAQQTGADKHLQQGAAHLRQHQPDPAIRELTRAVALNPLSAPAHLLLGEAYLAKGDAALLAEAKAEFQQARELDPAQVLASFYIAKIDLDLGRLGRAERELRRALESSPGASYLIALLGEVRRRQGKPDEAIDLTTRALATDPNAIPVLYFRALAHWDRKNEALAVADLDRAMAPPFVTPEMHLLLGGIHLHGRRFKDAESAFRKAIGLGPRAEAHLRLAQALRLQRRYAEAISELNKVEAAPQLTSEYFQRLLADAACEKGLILRDQGDTRAASAAFQRAVEYSPEHEEARRQLDGLR